MTVTAVWSLVAFIQFALAVTSGPQSLWPGSHGPAGPPLCGRAAWPLPLSLSV